LPFSHSQNWGQFRLSPNYSVVVVDIPHHVTQRGNARQVIFSGDSDRLAYLELLRQYCELYRLSLLGGDENGVKGLCIARANSRSFAALRMTTCLRW